MNTVECVREEIFRRSEESRTNDVHPSYRVHSSVYLEFIKDNLVDVRCGQPYYANVRLIVDDRMEALQSPRGTNPFLCNNMTERAKFIRKHPEKAEFMWKLAGLKNPYDDIKWQTTNWQDGTVTVELIDKSNGITVPYKDGGYVDIGFRQSIDIVRKRKHKSRWHRFVVKCRWLLRKARWQFGW
jgi:hypothetical protein